MLKFILLLSLFSLSTCLYDNFEKSHILEQQDNLLEVTYRGQGYDESHIINMNDYDSKTSCNKNNLILELNKNTKDELYNKFNEVTPIFITNSECLGPIYQVNNFKFNENTLITEGKTTSIGSIVDELDFEIRNYKGTKDYNKQFCFGLNVDNNNCSNPKDLIDVYKWEESSKILVDITCPDCLVSFEGDVFLHLQIRRGNLVDIKGGVENSKLYLASIFNIDSQVGFNIGTTKVLPLLPPITIFDFSLLTIPLKFWLDIPAQLDADLILNGEGDILLGWESKWEIGDYFIEWEKNNGWNLNLDKPSGNSSTVFNTISDIELDGELSLSPNIRFHLDKVFQTNLLTVPTTNLKTEWDSNYKTICANITYQLDITASAEFDIDVNWLGIHKRHKWGPKYIYDSGDLNLINKCKNIK